MNTLNMLINSMEDLNSKTQEYEELLNKKKDIEQEMLEKLPQEKNLNKRNIMNNTTEYVELMDDALFEEVFLLLEQNIEKIDNPIARSKYFKEFFTEIFSKPFDKIYANGKDNYHLNSFSKTIYAALTEKEFLRPMTAKLLDFVKVDKLMVLFSNAITNNEFEIASYYLKYIDKDLTSYPQTFSDVINKNNIEALKFLCKNMDNIHFNNDALLRVASGCSTNILKMLIEDFHYNLNELSENGSLIHILVQEENVKNFAFVVDNYSNVINWGKSIKKGTVFDLIDKSKTPIDFFEPLLEDMSLKDSHISRIMNSLFSNAKAIQTNYESDVYSKLFSHPNFDPSTMNLGQGYLLYGLLSELGRVVNQKYKEFVNENPKEEAKSVAYNKAEEAGKPYLKILKDFLNSYPSDTVPDATNYNIIGAAVHVANDSQREFSTLHNAANLIMRRYPVYINKPNPQPLDTLPIMQVSKDTEIYKILLSNGAIAPEAETGFFRSITSFLRRKDSNVQAMSQEQAQNQILENKMPNSKLIALRNQMREDFKIMRADLVNPLCDSVIKFKCENMFLKSEKLVMMMDKHSVTNAIEDVHFLGNNFSNYLKESLSTYIAVCEAIADLGADEKLEKQFNSAKDKCLEQIELLTEQLNLISENIYNEVKGSADRNQNVRSRFLAKRFGQGTDYGVQETVNKNNERMTELKSQAGEDGASMNEVLSDNETPTGRKFKR